MKNRSKLVTIRMVESDVDALDKIARDTRYYSRSDVINAAVRLIVQPQFEPFIRGLLRFCPSFGHRVKKLELEFDC